MVVGPPIILFIMPVIMPPPSNFIVVVELSGTPASAHFLDSSAIALAMPGCAFAARGSVKKKPFATAAA